MAEEALVANPDQSSSLTPAEDASAIPKNIPPDQQPHTPPPPQKLASDPAVQSALSKEDNLRRILSIKVPLIVKIAEKRLKIGEVLKLGIGSVVQFEKDAYQHVDLMVNNSTIGLGQPVKVGEKFGLKITEVGDLAATIRSLGDHAHQNLPAAP